MNSKSAPLATELSTLIGNAHQKPSSSGGEALTERLNRLAELKAQWAERESPRQQESTTVSTILHLNDTLPPMPGKPHNRRSIPNGVWDDMLACAVVTGEWPITMLGPVGTGKTCAALCLLDLVGTRRYTTVQTMCDELIAAQRDDADRGPTDWWHRWSRAKCCVLDELGTRDKVSEFQYECVKRAIDSREGAPLICISNATIGELANLYDDRIASRLAGGTVIHFTGDDRRIAR